MQRAGTIVSDRERARTRNVERGTRNAQCVTSYHSKMPVWEQPEPLLYLAPMAGVTNSVFRRLCKEQGADVLVTEFVSAEGILHRNQRTREMVAFTRVERPLGVQ